ncbi:MAG: M43 family zinc metalloprotease, partial [Flavobacteriales bacterium]
MKKISLSLSAFVLILGTAVQTSAQHFSCDTHERTEAILAQHPEKRAELEQLERETLEYTEANYGTRAGAEVRVIPTVIHVVHDNGSENLSKAALLSALESVNEELRAQNGNLSSIVAPFSSIIGDPRFELRLAKIDYQGNCTDGITRTVSNQTYSADEDVKDLVNWNDNSRRYLQVWVVNTVGSGAGGYTYLPGSVNARRNGIILRAAQFQSSLTHEFGHWMNLSHVWGGSNDNANPSNCNGDDGVSDTPNTIGTESGCNTNQMTCGSQDNVQNHMDYSACGRMFTEGQALRMQFAAGSSTGGRSTYSGSSNRSATGTSDGFTNVCTPNVEFFLDNNLGCEGIEVEFEDNSWGADEDPSWVWSWSFPGGTPSTSNEQNPTVTYNSAGTYNVSLTITTDAGSETETVNDAVVVTQLGGGITGSWTEGMEDSSFPNNSTPGEEWTIESPGGLTWQRSSTAAFTGSASARINLRSVTEGNINNLISPPIDMTDIES